MEIIYDILSRISESGSILKTHILYGANLNSKSLEKFLHQLTQANIISKVSSNGKTYYTLTLRGRALLSYMRRIYSLLDNNSAREDSPLLALQTILSSRKAHVVRNHKIKGASGYIHVYPVYMVSNNSGIAIQIVDVASSIEDIMREFSTFMLSLIDTESRGVFMVPERHYETLLRFHNTITKRSTLPNSIRIGYYTLLDTDRVIAERILRIINI